jgi:hypothetical protein
MPNLSCSFARFQHLDRDVDTRCETFTNSGKRIGDARDPPAVRWHRKACQAVNLLIDRFFGNSDCRDQFRLSRLLKTRSIREIISGLFHLV